MSIFISYSRRDAAAVRRLHEALAARGREMWVDWDGIAPSADWLREIEAAINAAEAVVFVLSPDAAASMVCRQEIAYAVAGHKRLLPVVCRDVDAAAVPPELARLNWVWLREADDFDAAVATLLQAVDTDLDWVQAHTRLLVRAAEWDARSRDASLALRGAELAAAEQWLALGPAKTPRPNELQTRYVIDSRRDATARRYRLLGAGAVAAVLVSVLGVLFVLQRQATANQQEVALARRLAATAERLREPASGDARLAKAPDLSLQLAAEAMRRLVAVGASSIEVDLALRRALSTTAQAVATPLPAQPPRHQFDELVFTADRLVAVSKSGLVSDQWDAAGLAPRGWARDGAGDLRWLELSPDGRFFATLGYRDRPGVVDLWAVDGTAPLASLPSPDHQVTHAALFPGGSHIAVGTARLDAAQHWVDEKVRLWRWPGPQLVAELPNALSLTFSPDGLQLAATVDEQATVWDMVSLLAGDATPRRQLGPGGGLLFSPDGSHLAVQRGPDYQAVDIWRAVDWTKVAEVRRELPVALGPQGRLLAVRDAADHSLLHVVEVAGDREVARIQTRGQQDPAAFSPDGERLAVGSLGRVEVWRVAEQGGATASLSAPAARGLQFAANGRVVLSERPADAKGGATAWQLWNPAGSTPPVRHALPAGAEAIALSADGGSVAIAAGNQLDVADAATGAVRTRIATTGRALAAALSGDGRVVAVATDRRLLHVAPTRRTSDVTSVALPTGTRVRSLSVSSDGGQVVALAAQPVSRAGEAIDVQVWRRGAEPAFATRPIDTSRGGLAATACAWSADGQRIAVSTRGAFVVVRDALDGRDLATVDAVGAPHCAFSGDRQLLAVADAGGNVRVWDLATQLEIARVENLPQLTAVALSADGQSLATLQAGGRASIWPVAAADLLASACSRLQANLSAADWARYVGARRRDATCPKLPVPPAAGN